MKYNKKILSAAFAASLILAAAPCTANTAYKFPQTDTTANTLFSVASVSKVYVTTAAMQLADQGKIDIDAPVTDYLPDFRLADPRYKDITVRMLMDHRSGLMGSYYKDNTLIGGMSTLQHDHFLQDICGERLKAAPGEYGAYCNDGFELLEQVVEAVSGESFTDYVEHHIAKPLGLSSTGTPWSSLDTTSQSRVFSCRAEFPTEHSMTIGAGGMLTTAEELSAFGSAFFTGNTVLLSDKAKDEMRKRAADDPYEDGFGLGWDTVGDPDYDAAGVQLLSKGGDLVFQHAELMVAPDEEISIAVTSAGGGSGCDAQLARALMDIALEEKDITVDRSEPEQKNVLDCVPDEYMRYAGYYLRSDGLYELTFPEQKYALIRSLTDPTEVPVKALYTDEDSFVGVHGDAANGKAVQRSDEQDIIRFRERNGKVYLTNENISGDGLRGFSHSPECYAMQKVDGNSISEDVWNVWEARSGKRYYFCNDSAFSFTYCRDMTYVTLSHPTAGYVNGLAIKNATHAETFLEIPSSANRDMSDMEIITRDGKEYLYMSGQGHLLISEDSIPDLPDDLKGVDLTSGEAMWYNIPNEASRTVTLDIPDDAAVYAYDQRGKMVYSSLMKNYGNTVPLPANGKVVFIGETGSRVGLD